MGEPGAGGADSLTRSGAVASAITRLGRAVIFVRTVGFAGAGPGVVGVDGVAGVAGVVGVTGVAGVVDVTGVAGVVELVSPAGAETPGVVCAALPPGRPGVLARATPAGAIAVSANARAMIALAPIASP